MGSPYQLRKNSTPSNPSSPDLTTPTSSTTDLQQTATTLTDTLTLVRTLRRQASIHLSAPEKHWIDATVLPLAETALHEAAPSSPPPAPPLSPASRLLSKSSFSLRARARSSAKDLRGRLELASQSLHAALTLLCARGGVAGVGANGVGVGVESGGWAAKNEIHLEPAELYSEDLGAGDEQPGYVESDADFLHRRRLRKWRAGPVASPTEESVWEMPAPVPLTTSLQPRDTGANSEQPADTVAPPRYEVGVERKEWGAEMDEQRATEEKHAEVDGSALSDSYQFWVSQSLLPPIERPSTGAARRKSQGRVWLEKYGGIGE